MERGLNDAIKYFYHTVIIGLMVEEACIANYDRQILRFALDDKICVFAVLLNLFQHLFGMKDHDKQRSSFEDKTTETFNY